MTVVQYEQPPPLPPSQPGDELQPGPAGDVARLRAAAEYAGYIGDTEFVPDQLRGRNAAIAAAILYGAEVGLTPMAALRSVVMIKGKPSLYAEAQVGLVRHAGHELWFEETTVTRAIAAGRRAGEDRIGRITWTMDDAKRAGLAGQHNYRTYPAEMLRARASAALVRAMFSDVALGIPAFEELEGEPDNGTPALPATPPPDDAPPAAPTSRTRRRRTTAATPAPAPPDPEPEPERPRPRPPVPPTPPPDEQPEPPAPDPADEPAATDAQKRQIFALMRDVGFTAGDRDERLAYTNRIVGRELESSNDLTIREAGLVIDDLQEIAKLAADERRARIAGDQEAAVIAALEQVATAQAEDDDIPY